MRQLLIFLCMLATAFCLDFRTADLETIQGSTITVQVEGEVADPGPVTAHPYVTVQEVLEEVEVLPDADLTVLNPDMVLNDHDVLRIPAKKNESEPQRVSINTGTAEDLSKLPGIGPSTAEKIILYRSDHGLFQKTEDLMNVKGIGRARYDAIADLITL